MQQLSIWQRAPMFPLVHFYVSQQILLSLKEFFILTSVHELLSQKYQEYVQ